MHLHLTSLSLHWHGTELILPKIMYLFMDSSGWYVDNLSTPYNEVNYNGHLVAKGFISMDSPNHKMSTM